MSIRHYSNTATDATLTSGVTAVDVTFSCTSFADYPAAPFTATIARGEADEEIVLVTVVSGSTVTVVRGYDGTTAKVHSAGASFEHTVIAEDYDEANTHVNATGATHGVTGTIVGTSDTQTLTNKTLTTPVLQSPSVTGTASIANATLSGTLSVTGVTALTGALTANGGVTVPAGQATAVDSLTAATAHVTGTSALDGNATVGGTLAATGAITGPSITVTGLAKGNTLESVNELIVAQLAAAPSGVASKGKLWAQTDGGLYTRQGATTPALRLTVHWGSGTSVPSSGVIAGDTFNHTGLGCFLIYTGSSWRQMYVPAVATATARTALSTTYSAVLYAGFRVRQTDTGDLYEWSGTAWVIDGGSAMTRQWVVQRSSGNASDLFNLGSMVSLCSGTLTGLPAGDYLVSCAIGLDAPSGATQGNLRLMVGGVGQSEDVRADLDTDVRLITYTTGYQHSGGDLDVDIMFQTTSHGGQVWTNGTRITLAYLGPR